MRVPRYAAEKIDTLALKEMDPLMLFHSLSANVQRIPELNGEAIDAAVEFATYVHRNQKRANRAGFPKTAYIEHPLRNAIRVLRFGTRNQSVVIGCILHDTVEDHAQSIAEDFCNVFYPDESVNREQAFSFIGKTFGVGAERVVRGMSNPLNETDVDFTVEQKNQIYFNHVKEATEDPEVLICKISDYIDNALSLHHTTAGMKPESLKRRAIKYLPLHELFMDRLNSGVELPVSETGKLDIIKRLKDGRTRLIDFSEAA